MSTTKNDAQLLPEQLAAELAALAHLSTYEERRDAVNGALGIKSIRARYLSQLEQLRRTHDHSEALCIRIGTAINRQCDLFIIEVLPPAGSGRYAGIPRST